MKSVRPYSTIAIVSTLSALWGIAYITGIWGLQETLGFPSKAQSPEVLVFYTGMKLSGPIREQGQWWRLLSSSFVHLGILHLVCNAYGAWILGRVLELFFGWKRLLFLYMSAALFSSTASLLWSDVPSGGASGVRYSFVGVLLFFGYRYRHQLPEHLSKALTTGMLPWVLFSLSLGFWGPIPMDNAAHFAGLIR